MRRESLEDLNEEAEEGLAVEDGAPLWLFVEGALFPPAVAVPDVTVSLLLD
jgi:hypothetical protein